MKKILISLFVLPALLAASQQFPTQAMHKYRTVLTEEQNDAAAVEIFNALHKRCLAKVPSKESSKSTALSPVENKWLWRRTHDGQLRITPEEVKAINNRAIPLLLAKFKKQAEEEQGQEGESWTARQMRSFVWKQFGLEESATNVIYVPSKKNSRYKRASFPFSVHDISTDTCCVDEHQRLSLGLCCLTSLDGIQSVKGANDGFESGLRHLAVRFNSFGKRALQPLSGLQYLQTLDVTGSHFTLKKGKFPQLPFLEKLILYHNNVPKLEPGMLDLPALKELDVRQCNLARVVPGAFDQCPQLTHVIIANLLGFSFLGVHDTPLWQDAVRNAREKRARDNAIKCLFRGTLQDDVMVALRALCHVPYNVEVS